MIWNKAFIMGIRIGVILRADEEAYGKMGSLHLVVALNHYKWAEPTVKKKTGCEVRKGDDKSESTSLSYHLQTQLCGWSAEEAGALHHRTAQTPGLGLNKSQEDLRIWKGCEAHCCSGPVGWASRMAMRSASFCSAFPSACRVQWLLPRFCLPSLVWIPLLAHPNLEPYREGSSGCVWGVGGSCWTKWNWILGLPYLLLTHRETRALSPDGTYEGDLISTWGLMGMQVGKRSWGSNSCREWLGDYVSQPSLDWGDLRVCSTENHLNFPCHLSAQSHNYWFSGDFLGTLPSIHLI